MAGFKQGEIQFWRNPSQVGFILSGIHFGWGSLKTGFSFGEIRVRRDSVLARFALGEIHFGGISDDGFWNGGILSYSPA